MKIVFLDAATLGDVSLEVFNGFGEAVLHPATQPDERADRVRDAAVIVTNKVVIDEAVLKAAPKLKLVLEAATGVNNIDLNACKNAGVAVANVAGYSTESVVAHTFALYFHLAHRMDYHTRYGRAGWAKSFLFTDMAMPFNELAGKRWGIVGMGAIGRRVAQAAQAFGAQVVYASTSGKNSDQPYALLPLEELLQTADVVSIHAPLNDQTRNLIGARELGLMKPSALLLNLGRGGIVDEAALAGALQKGQIAGAGLDVLSSEPPKADNPLFEVSADRLAITPHIAWASREARTRLVAEMAENLKAFTENKSRNRIV